MMQAKSVKKRIEVFNEKMGGALRAGFARQTPGTPMESYDDLKKWPLKLPKTYEVKEGDEETKTGTEEDLDAHLLDKTLHADFFILCAQELGSLHLWRARCDGRLFLVIGDEGGAESGIFLNDLFDETEENRDDDGGL